ncbi:MAG: hypothetical protein A3I01_16370 [Betaproteobacteria bacterium RIFCSPLOWO2_02_FULL_65_24]|nr:MAG: hypothetical protein A3I01_16370 [Betaproteobacteria bacterium RIFCSPLOWO2_02_FULL_65_24]
MTELRATFGGPGVSDEEFLLRYIMKGETEVEAMRAAGAPRQYFNASLPLLTLLQELGKHKAVRYINVQRSRDRLSVENRSLN